MMATDGVAVLVWHCSLRAAATGVGTAALSQAPSSRAGG